MPGPTPGSEPAGQGGAHDLTHVFRYEDASGTLHIVDAVEKVPEKYRDTVDQIDLGALKDKAEKGISKAKDGLDKAKEGVERAKQMGEKGYGAAQQIQKDVGKHVPFVASLHLPSVAFGVALSLGVVVGVKVLLGTAKMIIKLVLLVVIVALVAGLYFGWVGKASGHDHGALSSPGELVDDAKKAVEKANERLKNQENMLKKIEEGVK